MTERELEVWLSDWFSREGVEVVEDAINAEAGDGYNEEVFLRRLAVDLRDALGLPA